MTTHDSGHTRRTLLTRGALLGGSLVPATLVAAEVPAPSPGGPFDVRGFGALGDGKALDTAALQGAIDACHRAGGGTVRIPPGTYLTKPIALRSFVTLHLEAGSTILGSGDVALVLDMQGVVAAATHTTSATQPSAAARAAH